MSGVRFTLFRKGFTVVVLGAASAVTTQSCGFPDHQFISDQDFAARGKAGAHVTGPDASTGTGGEEAGGGTAAGGYGTGGAGAGGAATGGAATGAGGMELMRATLDRG